MWHFLKGQIKNLVSFFIRFAILTFAVHHMNSTCMHRIVSSCCIRMQNLRNVHVPAFDLDFQTSKFRIHKCDPLTILHWCMKYQRCRLTTFWIDLWLYKFKICKHAPLIILHMCIKYKSCRLKSFILAIGKVDGEN